MLTPYPIMHACRPSSPNLLVGSREDAKWLSGYNMKCIRTTPSFVPAKPLPATSAHFTSLSFRRSTNGVGPGSFTQRSKASKTVHPRAGASYILIFPIHKYVLVYIYIYVYIVLLSQTRSVYIYIYIHIYRRHTPRIAVTLSPSLKRSWSSSFTKPPVLQDMGPLQTDKGSGPWV